MKTEKTATFAARIAALLLCLLILACPLVALCAEGDGENTPAETETEAEGVGVNFAETVSDFLDRHTGEIFSALSLVGTILLAWLARRGLLPAMQGGLRGLAAGVDRLTDAAKSAGESQNRMISDLVSEAEPVLRDLSGMRDLFASLADRTAELERKTAEAKSENEKLLALNRAAIEMLKEVFTAAKLPVTSKEELAAIYRRALDAVEDGGEAAS